MKNVSSLKNKKNRYKKRLEAGDSLQYSVILNTSKLLEVPSIVRHWIFEEKEKKNPIFSAQEIIKMQRSDRYSTLTEIETIGLTSNFNLSDGHAQQDLDDSQAAIVDKLPQLWRQALQKKQKALEEELRDMFAELGNQTALLDHPSFQVCPTASQSIDIVGAFLRQHSYKTLLLEPTFDNLALLLRRREVELFSLSEKDFVKQTVADCLQHRQFDAIFLVHPNNPTGTIFSRQKIIDLIEWCGRHQKLIILDHSFRFFVPTTFDIYAELLKAKVAFLTIEDTGKVWPTIDMKVSLLAYSCELAPDIEKIYQELFLCTSGFTISVLLEFMRDTLQRGLDVVVYEKIEKHRTFLRKSIENTVLQVHPEALASKMSIEWLQVQNPSLHSEKLVAHLLRHGVAILPGSLFYWNSSQKNGGDCVRISLSRPSSLFKPGVRRLREILLTL